MTLAPTAEARVFRAPDGKLLTPPAGWACLPPGDAGLTRRVKAAGPSWAVVEKKGRKTFSQGVWAPAENIAAARAALDEERATPAYAKKRAADVQRREVREQRYAEDFELEVLRFLRFSERYEAMARKLARLVSAHATVVGSGTVARTQRISVERRAEAAVIAWMRHQTTEYDNLSIPRIKGKRREVRRDLAQISRSLLSLHRGEVGHAEAACPLCSALAKSPAPSA
ncbi:MAG TPA: DUF2293 domain-containing protein [Polyangiaceae bacterium]|nr:DUF2293 domain-containing protein [Polyangiaceae bacterium]